ARTRGLFCGPSSGAHLIAARRVREQYPELETVVTILDDEGEKYLHDFFMQPAAGAVSLIRDRPRSRLRPGSWLASRRRPSGTRMGASSVRVPFALSVASEAN